MRSRLIANVEQKIMAISAWDSFAKKESPDGRFIATYDDAMEVAMGAPTRGVIKISEKRGGATIAALSDANGSFIWSADSSSLAFPHWTRSRMQQLVVVRLPQGITEPLEGEYRVLELESFDHDLIEGIDSPIHHPSKVSVSVKK
jgi:hypothetical protein